MEEGEEEPAVRCIIASRCPGISALDVHTDGFAKTPRQTGFHRETRGVYSPGNCARAIPDFAYLYALAGSRLFRACIHRSAVVLALHSKTSLFYPVPI